MGREEAQKIIHAFAAMNTSGDNDSSDGELSDIDGISFIILFESEL